MYICESDCIYNIYEPDAKGAVLLEHLCRLLRLGADSNQGAGRAKPLQIFRMCTHMILNRSSAFLAKKSLQNQRHHCRSTYDNNCPGANTHVYMYTYTDIYLYIHLHCAYINIYTDAFLLKSVMAYCLLNMPRLSLVGTKMFLKVAMKLGRCTYCQEREKA